MEVVFLVGSLPRVGRCPGKTSNAVPLVVRMGIRIGSPRDKLLTTMERYLSTSTSASSDDIILAPYWINPKATDASKNIEEFKLQGKHHLRCKALMKGPKNAKPRSSPIWKWGEDIQLKD